MLETGHELMRRGKAAWEPFPHLSCPRNWMEHTLWTRPPGHSLEVLVTFKATLWPCTFRLCPFCSVLALQVPYFTSFLGTQPRLFVFPPCGWQFSLFKPRNKSKFIIHSDRLSSTIIHTYRFYSPALSTSSHNGRAERQETGEQCPQPKGRSAS